MTRLHILGVIILVVASSLHAQTTAPSLLPVETYLDQGRLADAEKAMNDRLAADPKDDRSRFSLGVVQFLHAVEHLSQTVYSYGPRVDSIRELDIPIPSNPNPKTLNYDEAREIVSNWNADLAKAESTLAQIKDPNVKLPLHLYLIRLDLAGDGHPGESETLWRILAMMRPDLHITEKDAADFYINFDAGDVRWLRGYCHLLMVLGEMTLAYDEKELFDSTAQIFFERVESPYPFLQKGRSHEHFDVAEISDVIAFIHLMHLPLKEPARMNAALEHLKAMIVNSRESWKLILAETDDDHEWIPNPKQKSVIGLSVTPEMVDGWLRFLDEADQLLAGKILLPFWRGDEPDVGINLGKVFTEPRPFDLVLWAQGTAAAPYLEHGSVTKPDVWRNLEAVFQGDIFTFAAWFN